MTEVLPESVDPGTAISLVGVLYVLMASAAAVHVILNKRNEGAAFSWLGIIVLSPLFGALFYALFGINRMVDRAQSFHDDAADRRPDRFKPPVEPDTAATAWTSDSALNDLLVSGTALHNTPVVGMNAIQPLINGDEAYPAMLESIRCARNRVLLSSYIFQNDAAGKEFVAALSDAQERGVVVRVLIDGVGARYGLFVGRADRALKKVGVKTARFLSTSSFWDWRFINLRNHRKLMVVDSHTAFVGGLNIRHGNLVASAKRHVICDVHFCMHGPVVAQIESVFLSDWFFATGEALSQREEECGHSNVEGSAVVESKIVTENHQFQWPTFPAVNCRVMVDGPDSNYEKLRLTLMAAINTAKHRICIVTPYFLPNSALLACLKLAVLRGVSVQVVLPERNNLRFVEWAMRANERRWLQSGIQLTLSQPPFDHSKLFIVDDEWTLIGSSNWDDRSLELNFEVNVECVDKAFNNKMYQLFLSKRDNGHRLQQRRDSNLMPRLRNNFFRLFSPFL